VVPIKAQGELLLPFSAYMPARKAQASTKRSQSYNIRVYHRDFSYVFLRVGV
jgi:hypothetical protein